MKRPADQAKLLFLYLLRSSAAALANSTPSRASTEAHFLLRLATRTDVPFIQRCNLATLPENYNQQFYQNHMATWPDLCLVAEQISSPQQQQEERRFLSYRNFPGMNPNNIHPAKPPTKIVGYVLGKVEEKVVQPPFASVPSRYHHNDYYSQQTELLGHVTSLAVLQEHRRVGLAGELMKQLHLHLKQKHCCNGVGLHVRKSNVAAAQLYQNDGYHIQNIIPEYYQDGEDAYFMKKEFDVREEQEQQSLALPRHLYVPTLNDNNNNNNNNNRGAVPNPTEPQISITGTM